MAKQYTQAEVDTLISSLTAGSERDNQGQIVIYTGIFEWENGEFHDQPDPNRFDDEEDA
jgi:hypothetical protein